MSKVTSIVAPQARATLSQTPRLPAEGHGFAGLLEAGQDAAETSGQADSFGAYGVFARERSVTAPAPPAAGAQRSGNPETEPAALRGELPGDGPAATVRSDLATPAQAAVPESRQGAVIARMVQVLETAASSTPSPALPVASRGIAGSSAAMHGEGSAGPADQAAPRQAPPQRSAGQAAPDIALTLGFGAEGARIALRTTALPQIAIASIRRTLSSFGLGLERLQLNGRDISFHQQVTGGLHGHRRS